MRLHTDYLVAFTSTNLPTRVTIRNFAFTNYKNSFALSKQSTFSSWRIFRVLHFALLSFFTIVNNEKKPKSKQKIVWTFLIFKLKNSKDRFPYFLSTNFKEILCCCLFRVIYTRAKRYVHFSLLYVVYKYNVQQYQMPEFINEKNYWQKFSEICTQNQNIMWLKRRHQVPLKWTRFQRNKQVKKKTEFNPTSNGGIEFFLNESFDVTTQTHKTVRGKVFQLFFLIKMENHFQFE